MKSQAQALSISICLFRSDIFGRWGGKKASYTIISPASCIRGTAKGEGSGGDSMLMTSQGVGVLWVLEIGVTYSNLPTALHFLETTLSTSVPSASKQRRGGARHLRSAFLTSSWRQPRGFSPGKEESVPCNSSVLPNNQWLPGKLRIIPDSEVSSPKTRISRLESNP